MDLKLRGKLVRKIERLYSQDLVLPVVSLDDFFKGNDDKFSFGRSGQFVPSECYEKLKALLARADVSGIFVEIHEIPDLEDEQDNDLWPSSFVFFIVTASDFDEVRKWVTDFQPRCVSEGWGTNESVKVPSTPRRNRSMRPIRIELR